MAPRLDLQKSAEAVRAMYALGKYVSGCGLEPGLIELVKVRASQLNGCAYCIDMHTQEARAAGETEQRLYALSAWREAPFFSPRERAALAWAEAVTQIAGGISDALFAEARQQFDEKQLLDLTWAVVAINGWNRIALAARLVPGTHKPEKKPE
jgi:AhpD family alkylhydroperoxidase